MGQLYAVEIIYRGVFQRQMPLARVFLGWSWLRIKKASPGISFGRYGDSPERNGIPAKSFAIVASDEQTLEATAAAKEKVAVPV